MLRVHDRWIGVPFTTRKRKNIKRFMILNNNFDAVTAIIPLQEVHGKNFWYPRFWESESGDTGSMKLCATMSLHWHNDLSFIFVLRGYYKSCMFKIDTKDRDILRELHMSNTLTSTKIKNYKKALWLEAEIGIGVTQFFRLNKIVEENFGMRPMLLVSL